MAKARGHEPSEAVQIEMSRFLARGLNRVMAATYVGVSPSMFDEMVRDGRMPQPKVAGSRVIWDRLRLDAYFNALSERGDDTPGDSFADWQ